ncbi:MAG: hypothetical protein ACRCXH_01585 [Shewanella sp.]
MSKVSYDWMEGNMSSALPRKPNLTQFIIDLEIKRLPMEQIRQNYRNNAYGKLSERIVRGYINQSGRV